MARVKLKIDKKEFEEQVKKLEDSNSFSNQSALWKALEETEWGKNNKLTAPVAYLRAKEFGTVIKTLVGKRGRQAGFPIPRAGKRSSRREKLKKFAKNFEQMRQKFPKMALPVINRSEAGSLKAAVNLKCLDCSNFQREEIRFCTCYDCPLFPFRPYQVKDEETLTQVANHD